MGNQYIINFPEGDSADDGLRSPMEAVLCGNEECSLVQLRHTVNPDLLYRQFWYKSGINQTMRNALKDVTESAQKMVDLKEGDIGEISLDAYPDQKFKATLYYISFSPKEGETGTVYELRLKLDEKAEKLSLKLAMSGDIDFLIKQEKNVLSAPSSFIKKDGKGNYVFVGKPDKNVKKYIDISQEIDGKYVITNGLQDKEIIYD